MHILQMSTAIPENAYSTKELLDVFPSSLPEEVRQNIINLGVSKRYLVDHYCSSRAENMISEVELVELCTEACRKTLSRARLSTKNIHYLIATYDVNPFLSPGLSQLLVRSIGFDPYIKHVNAQGIASTAFPKALELADNYLAAHPRDRVLICVSGVSSYWFHNQVRGITDIMGINQINKITNKAKKEMELRKWVATMQFFLFGDGVAAAIVTEDRGDLAVKNTVEVTNISKGDYLAGYARLSTLGEPFSFGFYSYLDKEIPRLGVKYTDLALEKLLGKNSEYMIEAAKKLVVHTGSEKILGAFAEHHGVNHEKLRESHEVLREYGNLAGASLPFILERILSHNTFSKGDLILMIGYGWGFSASASLLEFTEDHG